MSFWPFDPFASQLISGTGLVGCYADRRGYINFALAINLCCVNVWSEYVRRMIQPFAFTNNVITSLGTPDLRALYLFYYLRVLFYGLPSQYQSSLACRKWCLFGYFWLSQTSLVSKLVSRRSKPVSNDSNMFLFVFKSWPRCLSRPCRRRDRRDCRGSPERSRSFGQGVTGKLPLLAAKHAANFYFPAGPSHPTYLWDISQQLATYAGGKCACSLNVVEEILNR